MVNEKKADFKKGFGRSLTSYQVQTLLTQFTKKTISRQTCPVFQ